MSRTHFFLGLSLALASASAVADAQTKPVAPAPARTSQTGADAAFAAWDVDHNGNLSRQEFGNGWEKVRRTAEVEARLRKQFVAVDVNRNGAIDPAEYGTLILVKNAGKSAPPLSNFDASKDGKLQLAEYLRLVQILAPKQTAQDKPR
jgi:hypothetical protein